MRLARRGPNQLLSRWRRSGKRGVSWSDLIHSDDVSNGDGRARIACEEFAELGRISHTLANLRVEDDNDHTEIVRYFKGYAFARVLNAFPDCDSCIAGMHQSRSCKSLEIECSENIYKLKKSTTISIVSCYLPNVRAIRKCRDCPTLFLGTKNCKKTKIVNFWLTSSPTIGKFHGTQIAKLVIRSRKAGSTKCFLKRKAFISNLKHNYQIMLWKINQFLRNK